MPVTVVILIGLFAIQRFGTHRVGALFGPVVIVWFVSIAALGLCLVVLIPHVGIAVSGSRRWLGVSWIRFQPSELAKLAVLLFAADVRKANEKVQDQGSPLPLVKQVIAVGAGKGGVGKSTVAVNLACALAASGLRVGLLDADIYGPNAPTMLGVADQTPQVRGSGNEQVLTPIESCGIAMVSMGLLIDAHQPVIWRGPMLNGIIRQFLYQVEWGERDVLVVDLPPGTGDAQLSLAQAVPMAGVIIVTTPQMVSLQDARRGLAMFQQLGVPVLGVVENMSAFVPPDAPDKRYELFGRGGGSQLASESEVPLLAQLPMELAVVQGGDAGRPAVLSAPDSATAAAFRDLAQRLPVATAP
ncbi:MAG: sodium:proton antiporter [Synechococcaceae bacterium WBB_3_034]|nr:sodium:proton antiporter [Synechococcaceae bacterium WBB_3_034]